MADFICCSGMEANLNNDQGRGFTLLKEMSGHEVKYYLQFRAMSASDESKFIAYARGSKELKSIGLTGLSLSGKKRVVYCPFCGAKLS